MTGSREPEGRPSRGHGQLASDASCPGGVTWPLGADCCLGPGKVEPGVLSPRPSKVLGRWSPWILALPRLPSPSPLQKGLSRGR